jgi:formylglycine-generating enzyme required for sulfatase activity
MMPRLPFALSLVALLAAHPTEPYPLKDGRTMIRIAGAEYSRGSTAKELSFALRLCAAYRSDCRPEWFANEAGPVTARVKAFYIDREEVSWDAYRRCVKRGTCKAPDFKNCYGFEADGKWQLGFLPSSTLLAGDHPAVCVSWHEAVAYCGWAKKRLPSEDEWELAARGTLGRRYPWGDDLVLGRANIGRYDRSTRVFDGDDRDGHLETAPVSTFETGATREGVLNLAGNVWEWAADASADSSTSHVIRGGGWFNEPDMIRGAMRTDVGAGSRHVDLGFRCAWSAAKQ